MTRHARAPVRAARTLVGRTEELAVLRDALARGRARRPRVVLVEGPVGMGKTALVEAFLGELGAARVLLASGLETERDVAFAVVDQLLRAAGLRPAVLGPDGPSSEDHVVIGLRLLEVLED